MTKSSSSQEDFGQKYVNRHYRNASGQMAERKRSSQIFAFSYIQLILAASANYFYCLAIQRVQILRANDEFRTLSHVLKYDGNVNRLKIQSPGNENILNANTIVVNFAKGLAITTLHEFWLHWGATYAADNILAARQRVPFETFNAKRDRQARKVRAEKERLKAGNSFWGKRKSVEFS